MQDRLAELKKSNRVSKPAAGATAIEINDMPQRRASKASNPEMAQFFKDVDLVKKLIMNIKEATKRMEDIKQQIKLTTTAERERELSSELEPLITENNKKASLAKQILQKLREATEKMKAASKPAV
jgi:polyhydroxyalkanoate synthesis regulator phasin